MNFDEFEDLQCNDNDESYQSQGLSVTDLFLIKSVMYCSEESLFYVLWIAGIADILCCSWIPG